MKRSVWPRILGYFLACMLFLTLLSRAADAILLPVVRLQRPLPGALAHTVTLDGVIAASEEMPVSLIPGVQVARVDARAGQHIKVGETLLRYDMDALSRALREAERALRALRAERDETVENAERAAEAAERTLVRARDNLRIVTEEQSRATALAEMETLEAELALNRAQAASDTAFARAHDACAAARRAAYAEADALLYEARAAMDWAWSDMTAKAKSKYNELQSAVDEAESRGGDAHERAKRKRDHIPGARDYIRSRMAAEAVQVQYDQAKQAYEDVGGARREAEALCAAERAAVLDAQAALARAQRAQGDAALAQDAAMLAAKRALEDAEASRADVERALDFARLDARAQGEVIADRQAEADALARAVAANGAVTAPADGVITQVNVDPGDTASGAAIRLAPAACGLIARAAASEEEAKYVTSGMQARFQRAGDARVSQDAAVLTGIASTATGCEICFDLPDGAGEIGQAVRVTTTQNTQTYPMIVPLGAITESDGIVGVYRVRIGQGVLGDMEYAEFVAVTVIERDLQNAAISASLSDQDRVIASSDKPLGAGDRVRSAS